MRNLLSLLIFFGLETSSIAKVIGQAVTYKEGSTELEGYLAYDDTKTGKLPGVLVVHDWMGVGPNVKRRAEQLAQLGYVAFAADVYGKGVHPTDPKAAGETAGRYKGDRKLFRARVLAGLEELKKNKSVDNQKLAAIGYCFGGTGVLELARSGAPVVGVVSFHGGLESPTPQDAKNIKGKVLVLHGADDPFVPEKDVKGFEDEMRAAGIDWELVKYSKAVHAFTIPEAGSNPKTGAAYNAEADRRSWIAMQNFFGEIFK
ncbi:MAG: dienelactone hydrolase [Bdellovibrio sp.]|nr:MAG: dienelactone hydrolase [Bdellovibrio sp.]